MHKSESEAPICLFAVAIRVGDAQRGAMHTHACTELIGYRGCRGWLMQGDGRLRYEDGNIGVYQPGISHGDACDKGGVQLCVGIVGGQAERLPAGIWPSDPRTQAVFDQIHAALDLRDKWRRERFNQLGGWLVVELRRQLAHTTAQGQRGPYHVEAARRIIDARFSEDVSMVEIAEELAIHPDYLRQLFIKWVGESPQRYLIRKRMDAACDLLRLNQEPTARIAERVGIANPYYFSRLFHQRIGETPSHYRARYSGRP
jgi:AraC-like DNA-binding protein